MIDVNLISISASIHFPQNKQPSGKYSLQKKSDNKQKNDSIIKTFEQYVKECATVKWNESSPEPLAELDYKEELDLKNRAFSLFLAKNNISLKPAKIVDSPKSRNYRITSKRRVFCDRHGFGLGFSEPVKDGVVIESKLEPVEHRKIYQFLAETLSGSSFSSLARALNWLIIRGSYDRQFLIFNVFKMDGAVVKKLKQISDLLQKNKLVTGAIAYFDPTRSEYYLEAEKPSRTLQIKHLFGTRLLGLKVDEILMRYSPTGFSQINESMVPHMVELAGSMLKLNSDDHLLDLYCGYGLFSHTLGKQCAKVTGYELSSDAINSAREISKRLGTQSKMRFFSEKIDARLVREKISFSKQRELILLDPPRKGCEPGVIEELAARNPQRVLHIFCGTDVIPSEIKQWQKSGYQTKIIQPIDMFPGTPNLETMILLEKG